MPTALVDTVDPVAPVAHAMNDPVLVRPLAVDDLVAAAELHRRVLDMEFLSRYGSRFMEAYYDAWRRSPGGIALAAVDGHGALLGALLGAVDPAAHVRGMVRGHGVTLGTRLAAHALSHPALAKDLVVTRGRRYAGGLVRLVTARLSGSGAPPAAEVPAQRIGEITHVLVEPDRQGMGIGRALVDAAASEGRNAQLDELVLVTPPDLAARTFYERLGWLPDGALTSRSGESFLRFRLPLGGPGSSFPADTAPSGG